MQAIWASLATREMGMHPRFLFLEKPTYDYTASELEVLVLRRWRAAIGTREASSSEEALSRREFKTNMTTEASNLIPGGRWFPFITSDGVVQYLDLDSVELRPVVLIPTQFTKGDTVFSHIAVEIDCQEPTLVFNVALIMQTIGYTDDRDFIHHSMRKLQIWRVALIFNGVDGGSHLSANRLFELLEPGKGLLRKCLSLRGPHVAYHVALFPSNRCTTILNWTRLGGARMRTVFEDDPVVRANANDAFPRIFFT